MRSTRCSRHALGRQACPVLACLVALLLALAAGTGWAATISGAGLLAYAPKGTGAVLIIDVPGLLSTPPFQAMREQGTEFPAQIEALQAVAIFLLPGEPGADGRAAASVCGLARLVPGGRKVLEQALEGTEVVKVEGVRAYREDLTLTALIDKRTAAFGTDERALGRALAAHKKEEGRGGRVSLLDGRKVRVDECPHFVAKLLFFGCEIEIHHIPPSVAMRSL